MEPDDEFGKLTFKEREYIRNTVAKIWEKDMPPEIRRRIIDNLGLIDYPGSCSMAAANRLGKAVNQIWKDGKTNYDKIFDEMNRIEWIMEP